MTLSTEMTPRAWRMICYCVIGFLIYGLVLLMELLQNVHLNRIDEQLKELDRQVSNGEMDPGSTPSRRLPVSTAPLSGTVLPDGTHR